MLPNEWWFYVEKSFPAVRFPDIINASCHFKVETIIRDCGIMNKTRYFLFNFFIYRTNLKILTEFIKPRGKTLNKEQIQVNEMISQNRDNF